MKPVVKKIYVRNSFFVDIYNVVIYEKKLNLICEALEDYPELSQSLLQLISSNDEIILSFCVCVLFKCITMDNEKLFHRIFKTIKFKESKEIFKFNNDFFQFFAKLPSIEQIRNVKENNLSALIDVGKVR